MVSMRILEGGERFSGAFNSGIDIRVGMCQRNEASFELGRGEVDAAVEHGVEEAGVAASVGTLGRCVVSDWPVAEESREHRAHTISDVRHTGRPSRGAETLN